MEGEKGADESFLMAGAYNTLLILCLMFYIHSLEARYPFILLGRFGIGGLIECIDNRLVPLS
jgi:hypothetical protein